MPAQWGPGQVVRGDPVSPSKPEHFPNWNQEPNGAWARLSQGGCTSGLARKWVGTCDTTGSRFRQQKAGRPPSTLPRRNAAEHQPALERCGGGEAGAGPGRQVAAEAEEAAAAPAEGVWPGASRGKTTRGSLSSASSPLEHVGSTPPGPAPATASSTADAGAGGWEGREGPAPAPLRGVATYSAPTRPSRASKGRGAGGGARAAGRGWGGRARRALMRRRSGRTTDRVFPKWRQRWMWIPRAAPTAARARSALK